ncbi:MAG: ankyrin repeat domain-containing protein [Acidimicrobiales bacterium]
MNASRQQVQEFLDASMTGEGCLALHLLESEPSLASASIFTAAVVGDSAQVAELLAGQANLATDLDVERGWPPLLYACYSRWHRIDPTRMEGLSSVARLLLDAGASPNTNNGGWPGAGYRSALDGAVGANNPGVTELLLERGANPSDRSSLRLAVAQPDHRCLRLMLAAGASIVGGWALETAIEKDDFEAVALLLGAAGRTETPERVAELASLGLADAAGAASVPVVEALLAFGADPDTTTPEGSVLGVATRAGNLEVAGVLVSHGATDQVSVVDRFLGAVSRADRAGAERLLAETPDLLGRLTDADRATIVDAAGQPGPVAVALMLELGFSPHARNDLGETALHVAAYEGRPETVRLLLESGAEIDSRDANFDSTSLAFATVGSGAGEHGAGEHGAGEHGAGDWVTTVRLLIDAGASRKGVWISEKPPSEAVGALLRSYGITEEDPPAEPVPDAPPQAPAPSPAAVGEVAARLRTAYETLDLALLSSLLHPDVRWGGGTEGCSNREQALNWYRGLAELGLRGKVCNLRVNGSTISIQIEVIRPADGTRPEPPTTVEQVFRVSDGLIVEIGD